MAHPVDMHVGLRVRQRRWVIGITQQQLGDRVGTKFQQIQKYETGANRISASRLWAIAGALSVPVSFFFDGLDESEVAEVGMDELPSDKETIKLVSSYYAIPEPQRRRLLDLACTLSRAS